MEFKDYYQILKVPRTASEGEIKRAYRKLARKYHPDVSKEPDAEQRMKEINEAYAVLSDPEKRAAYDQLGSRWQAGQEFRPPPDWDAGFEFTRGGFGGFDVGDFSDFFSALFGHLGRRGGGRADFRARGEDHHAKIMIDLEDAFHGATRVFSLRVPELDARGHIRIRERSINVHIPKGIHEGQHIRLVGLGSPGVGNGPAGDLYLEVHFKPHPLYRTEGRDIYLTLPVTPWEAALGAAIKVPTPDGLIEVKIPQGSQCGRKLRLKGRGIPGSPPGDLYLVLDVVLPPVTDQRTRQVYETMAREMAFNPRQNMGV